MDVELKNKILHKYLKDKNIITNDPQTHPIQPLLFHLLDYIAKNASRLFHFPNIDTEPMQWKKLVELIDSGIGATPTTASDEFKVNTQEFLAKIVSYQNEQLIASLPQDTYYERVTKPVEFDKEFNALMTSSQSKLRQLICTAPDTLKQQLLIDLSVLEKLTLLSIPQENQPDAIFYCTLAIPTEGVTAKIALAEYLKVKSQLQQLCNAEPLTVASYCKNREQYCLRMDAILKLPKHGKIQEVQHEALALNISRMLGLDTTRSTLVSHNERPALLIPFDSIQLLREFASGKEFNPYLGKAYTHYSTMKPIGEGVQANQFTDDFGALLGLIFLCSDPDTIGGNCQNKALRNGRSLYVFDQILMADTHFALDSRLCLQPVQIVWKHTRHGLGRNRTLIEDSSTTNKFASLLQLIQKGPLISQYLSQVASTYHQRSQQVSASHETTHVLALEHDVLELNKVVEKRLIALRTIFPKTSGIIKTEDIGQAFLLEKLLHGGVLFSDDGRPYRQPWTENHNNPLQSVHELDNNRLEIRFTTEINLELLSMLQRQSGVVITLNPNKNALQLSRADLYTLGEDALYPEHSLELRTQHNYLLSNDFNVLKNAYAQRDITEALTIITSYLHRMNSSLHSVNEKIQMMSQTEQSLKSLISDASDKGFALHTLKKFYFDQQQQLQKLIPPHLQPKLNQAFSAAFKLDRISIFHTVVKEAVLRNKVESPLLREFLDVTIVSATAKNLPEAQEQSAALRNQAELTLQQLSISALSRLIPLRPAEPKQLDTSPESSPKSEQSNNLGENLQKSVTLNL